MTSSPKARFLEYNSVYFVYLGNVSLERAYEYKYLGLTMDNDLSFQAHRDNLENRVYIQLSYFKKVRKFINVDAAVTIYRSTILPVIEYADFVFDYGIKHVNKQIQSLQNQGLYIVYNQHAFPYLERDSSTSLHRRAKIFRP